MDAKDRDAEGRDAAPKRRVRKVRLVKQDSGLAHEPQATAGEPEAASPVPESQIQAGKRNYMHFFHFDAETGRVTYLDDEKSSFGTVCECHRCGTALQFEAERCPVCGTRFDEGDSGIVRLLVEGPFEWKDGPEMDCPQCGEHVTLIEGTCPACGATVMPPEGEEPDVPCGQVVNAENVVFVHLDVESGEVEYLQRLQKNRGFEHLAVHLSDAGSDNSQEG